MTRTEARQQFLISVIGNNDIALPPEAREADGRDARAVGAALLQRLAEGRTVHYRVELVPKYIAFLAQRGQRADRVVLIATDQPESEPRRGQDTVFYAKLVKRHLTTDLDFADDAVTIIPCTVNPADYGQTFPFIRQLCEDLRCEEAGATTYHLALTGGTPALTTALLSEGVSIFEDAEVLYLDRGAVEARSPQVALDLRAQALRHALRTHIDAHSYAAALDLCEREQTPFAALLPDSSRRDLVRALLRHATERLNANLIGAREALSAKQVVLLDADEREAILLGEETTAKRRQREPAARGQRIKEIIASAHVAYRQERYFDFITRIGTFVDMFLTYLALVHCGVQETPLGSKWTIAPWIDQHPELVEVLQAKMTEYNGIPNQRVYREVVTFLTRDTPLAPLAAQLCARNMEELTALRNDAVHEYGRIRVTTLREKWGDDPRTIIPALRAMAESAGITGIASDPYEAIQGALRRLLA